MSNGWLLLAILYITYLIANFDGFRSRWMRSLRWMNDNPSTICADQLSKLAIDSVKSQLWMTKGNVVTRFRTIHTAIQRCTVHQFHHNEMIAIQHQTVAEQFDDMRMFQSMKHCYLCKMQKFQCLKKIAGKCNASKIK
jgi:hypothetical protein